MKEYQLPFYENNGYEPKKDLKRISKGLYIVFNVMLDYNWRTFQEIQEEALTKYQKYIPEASISAHLRKYRHLNKGLSIVNKQRINDSGLWEYQLIPSAKAMELLCFDQTIDLRVYQKNYSIELHLKNGGTIENYEHDY